MREDLEPTRNQMLHLQRTYTVNTICCAVQYELQGVAFESDSDKADANVQKHGVSFHAACEVFFDPFVRIMDTSNPTESGEA